jgi:acyl transferase domain-containing protein
LTKTLSSFRNQRNDLDKRQDIAVVGLACRFPGSESIEEFWAFLCEGRFCIKDLSHQQASLRFFCSLPRQGGFLSEINFFDSDFFTKFIAAFKALRRKENILDRF